MQERGGMRHSEAVMIKPELRIFMRQAGNLKRPSARGVKTFTVDGSEGLQLKRSEARRVWGDSEGS